MPSYAECLAALPSFRNDVARRQQLEERPLEVTAFATHGAFSAFATPSSNVHATGVGIRQRGGKYIDEEHVLKLFVFDKLEHDAAGAPPVESWEGLPVDVEHLPVQVVRATASKTSKASRADKGSKAAAAQRAKRAKAATTEEAAAAVSDRPRQRERRRPIPGGLSISPLRANFVGTLGCFLMRRTIDTEEVFALSNNHVLADVDRLPRGTPIVQPGPEVPPFLTQPQDTLAVLHTAIPLHFPTGDIDPVVNRFDAAIANVTDGDIIERGRIFDLPQYDPSRVVSLEPGMRVVKSGRTTGVTHGIVTATNVTGVQINYGTAQVPRIAIFQSLIKIVGVDGSPFSLPGDSGSVILEEQSGHPAALLFAGDGRNTFGCDLGLLCQRLRAWPI